MSTRHRMWAGEFSFRIGENYPHLSDRTIKSQNKLMSNPALAILFRELYGLGNKALYWFTVNAPKAAAEGQPRNYSDMLFQFIPASFYSYCPLQKHVFRRRNLLDATVQWLCFTVLPN